MLPSGLFGGIVETDWLLLPMMLLMVLQMPIYGLVLGWCLSRSKYSPVVMIVIVHAALALIDLQLPPYDPE